MVTPTLTGSTFFAAAFFSPSASSSFPFERTNIIEALYFTPPPPEISLAVNIDIES